MAAAGVFELSKNDQIEQQSPNLYDDLLSQLHTVSKLHSSTGETLPPVDEEIIAKARYEQSSEYLGALASQSSFSTTTGCWSVLKGRNPKGYVQLYGPKKYGFSKQKSTGKNYGIGSHRLAYLHNLKEKKLGDTIPKGIDIDHICRNTACCNPSHLRGLSKEQNNLLALKARSLENALVTGQLIVGKSGIDWIDKPLIKAEQEDTGLVITTRFGPHRIIKLDDDPIVAWARREHCDIFDSLLPKAVDNRVRKSRAKQTTVHEGQGMLFTSIINDESTNDTINIKGRIK